MKRFLRPLVLALSMLPAAAFGCGSDSDYRLGERHCRIHIPKQSADHAMPALVFAHGFRGSAAGVMKNTAMIRWANDKGVALIALKSAGLDWDIPFAPRTFDSDGHAEEAYVQAVLEDAQKRFGIDRARVIMSGFSAGGMMTWHMACDRPDLFFWICPNGWHVLAANARHLCLAPETTDPHSR